MRDKDILVAKQSLPIELKRDLRPLTSSLLIFIFLQHTDLLYTQTNSLFHNLLFQYLDEHGCAAKFL